MNTECAVCSVNMEKCVGVEPEPVETEEPAQEEAEPETGGNTGMLLAVLAVAIVGDIAVVLAGAFPLVYVITRVFKTPLMKLGHVLGMNDIAAAGLVATLANNIPMFQMLHDMDRRGKIINVAFAVSAAFVFGDHLGFTAGFDSTMIFPMIVGKLVGGVTAVAVAMLITRKYKEERHG